MLLGVMSEGENIALINYLTLLKEEFSELLQDMRSNQLLKKKISN